MFDLETLRGVYSIAAWLIGITGTCFLVYSQAYEYVFRDSRGKFKMAFVRPVGKVDGKIALGIPQTASFSINEAYGRINAWKIFFCLRKWADNKESPIPIVTIPGTSSCVDGVNCEDKRVNQLFEPIIEAGSEVYASQIADAAQAATCDSPVPDEANLPIIIYPRPKKWGSTSPYGLYMKMDLALKIAADPNNFTFSSGYHLGTASPIAKSMLEAIAEAINNQQKGGAICFLQLQVPKPI